MQRVENWKVVDWSPRYSVSNLGRVRNNETGQFLIGHTIKGGYSQLLFSMKGSKSRGVLRHRLVAEFFLPKPDGYREVNHIDGDKKNNHVSNLEWCTRLQNMQHAYRTGLMSKAHGGERNGNSKLKEADVLDILDSGMSASEAALKYGITYQNARFIIRRDTWKHVQRTSA